MELDPAAALQKLIRSPNTESVSYRPGNHLTLTAKTTAKNEIIKREFNPRSLLLSKILTKKKHKTKLTKEKNPANIERKTMMYVGANHGSNSHNTGHTTHHHRPMNHGKVPEGYYRCSHGCLCKKGMHHEGPGEMHHSSHQPMHGHHGQGMHGGMHGPGMHGGMQGGMHGPGMYGPGMHGGMQGGMYGPGMGPPQTLPPPTNPIIKQVGSMGSGLMGMLGQGIGVANGLSQQFNGIAAGKYIFSRSYLKINK